MYLSTSSSHDSSDFLPAMDKIVTLIWQPVEGKEKIKFQVSCTLLKE